MNLLLNMQLALPLVAIATLTLAQKHTSTKVTTWLHLAFMSVLLVTVTLTYFTLDEPYIIHVGNWADPFAIKLAFDEFSTLMMMLFVTVACSVTLYSISDTECPKQKGTYYAGVWFLLLGVMGALSTFDIFNLYVWSEVMLVSAFMLLIHGNKDNTSSLYTYAIINILGTLVMLAAIGLIYGITGTLNYDSIASFYNTQSNILVQPALLLLLIGLSVKGGVFPFYFWLPKAYPDTTASTTLLLSSMVTKTVMLVILRLVWLWPPLQTPLIQNIFIALACATMFFGVMGAANQTQVRSILSFHVVSQLGYVLLAIFISKPLAVAAALFFIIHNIFIKTNLLMISGIVEKHYPQTSVYGLNTLLRSNVSLGLLFIIPAFSLAGFPPFSGFWAKLLVLKAALYSEQYIALTVAIVVSFFTLYSMIKIWRYAFCELREHAELTQPRTLSLTLIECLSILPLFIIPLLIGLFPDLIMTTLNRIAESMAGQ